MHALATNVTLHVSLHGFCYVRHGSWKIMVAVTTECSSMVAIRTLSDGLDPPLKKDGLH